MNDRHEDTKARRHRGGFTLVEMTIVIGIIVLLAGLTLAVSVSVVQGSERRQTELTIKLLDAAVQEWEAQADRKITYGINGQPAPALGGPYPVYEIQQPVPLTPAEGDLVTKKLMAILLRAQGSKQILAQIDPEFVEYTTVDDDDDSSTPDVQTLIVSDAWGKHLAAVFPGRPWVQSDYSNFNYVRNDDGTIQTESETECGVAVNKQICFVSGGPDEQLGNLYPNAPDDMQSLAQDNLYSFAPATPQMP